MVVVVVVRTWCSTRVSVHPGARVQLIKTGQCQCTDPFGWTDQPEKALHLVPPKAGSRCPQCKPHPMQTQGEEKDCEARPPHKITPKGKTARGNRKRTETTEMLQRCSSSTFQCHLQLSPKLTRVAVLVQDSNTTKLQDRAAENATQNSEQERGTDQQSLAHMPPPNRLLSQSSMTSTRSATNWKELTSSPHSFGGRGAQSFPPPRRWMPWIRIWNDIRSCSWTSLLGMPDPFTSITTSIRRMTRSNTVPFTNPRTNPR